MIGEPSMDMSMMPPQVRWKRRPATGDGIIALPAFRQQVVDQVGRLPRWAKEL